MTDWANVATQLATGVVVAGATIWAARTALKGAIAADRADRREARDERLNLDLQEVLAEARQFRRMSTSGHLQVSAARVPVQRDAVARCLADSQRLSPDLRQALSTQLAHIERYNALANYVNSQAWGVATGAQDTTMGTVVSDLLVSAMVIVPLLRQQLDVPSEADDAL